ncbi:Xylulose kinase [Rubrobacter xylanophilus DSM 9941]|uniref:FGGY-family carbohydrate kinase n=1 Tax=Rubrobacter xylanophilus TaxID=49319 RepID=UPI001C63BF72|nr:FGGY-family carbohydrate kinase [Rubrobacter xylanophilus]QYJ17034.1 Xylulose kinase [Rubrobacter xylanophilus DSM 9941]
MSGELLLGVDIGTSSSKGVLARPGGEVVATAERPHSLSMPRPGWAEHDAEGVWWADFVGICRELLEKADGRVAAVCTSGIGACLLPADAAGKPLRPAILYGIDTRAEAEIEELNARYGEEDLLRRCGSVLTTQAVGPKLLWLRRNEPGVWERTAKVFMANSFIAWRLTGEYVLDHHSASQCDPLYDVREYRWIEEWAEEIAPGLPLPRLLWPAEVAGEVTPEAAEETGIPAGTPVAAGTIDAWSEGASVGVQEPGDLMLMYGTTMFIIEVVREPLHHPGLWGTTGILPGTRNLAAGMATSGALTGWLREISGGLPYERLTREAAAVPPGSDGLVVLPYFAGERTPLFDPRARGLIGGLTLRHGRGHLYRAVLEATAYGVRHIFESMREAGGGGERLVAVGGGTKGRLWTQIVSDVTGRPQDLPEETIGAAYGDALLAARAVGLAGRDEDWSRISDTVEPDEANRDLYDELYRVYRELYPATREQMHRLADLQREGSSG